jgi:hypothetical protein
MNLDIIQLLADSGVALLVTIVLLYWNRMDAKDRLEEMKQLVERERCQADQERADKLLMIETLQHNTEVLSELLTMVKRLNGKP